MGSRQCYHNSRRSVELVNGKAVVCIDRTIVSASIREVTIVAAAHLTTSSRSSKGRIVALVHVAKLQY